MIHRCCILLLFALLASLSGGCSRSMKMPPESMKGVMMSVQEASETVDHQRWQDPAPERLAAERSAEESSWSQSHPPQVLAALGDASVTKDFRLFRAGKPTIRLEGIKGSIASGRRAMFSDDGMYVAGCFWRAPLRGWDFTPDLTVSHIRVWEVETGKLVFWQESGPSQFLYSGPNVAFLRDHEITMTMQDEQGPWRSIFDIRIRREVARKWW